MELVDKRDLKSLGQKCPYGFDPRPEHKKISYNGIFIAQPDLQSGCLFIFRQITNLPERNRDSGKKLLHESGDKPAVGLTCKTLCSHTHYLAHIGHPGSTGLRNYLPEFCLNFRFRKLFW